MESTAVSNVLAPANRLPLALKLAYTAFMAVLVPVYWYSYGPTNFLFFCDVALFLTLAAVWLESPLLSSMPAVGILVPQALWVADFATASHVTGMTAYMFDSKNALFARGLSLFHGWLPFLLVYLVWRLGYDRRALVAWTVLAWILMAICYLWMPAPLPAPSDGLVPTAGDAMFLLCGKNPPTNINYVFGPGETAQEWMHPHLWFFLLALALPVCFYLPAHFLLGWLFPRPHLEGAAPV